MNAPLLEKRGISLPGPCNFMGILCPIWLAAGGMARRPRVRVRPAPLRENFRAFRKKNPFHPFVRSVAHFGPILSKFPDGHRKMPRPRAFLSLSDSHPAPLQFQIKSFVPAPPHVAESGCQCQPRGDDSISRFVFLRLPPLFLGDKELEVCGERASEEAVRYLI